MSLYAIQDTTLIGIGDAIRAKGGTSDAIPVTDLADAITNLPSGGGGGSGAEIPTTIAVNTLKVDYFFGGDRWKWMLDVVPANKSIEFNIMNGDNAASTEKMLIDCTGDYSRFIFNPYTLKMPMEGKALTHLPVIKFRQVNTDMYGMTQFFMSYSKLRNIPRDFFYACDANGNKLDKPYEYTLSSKKTLWGFFDSCSNLRTLPEFPATYSYSGTFDAYGYYETFRGCYSLDKIEGLPVTLESATANDDMFSDCFYGCYRLSEMTFQVKPDGTPYKCNWSNQYLGLFEVGYGFNSGMCNEYNGLSKNDERYLSASGWVNENINIERPDDWWASSSQYGRYNHDSAVRTINSLPDCSSGTNNIIHLRRDSGMMNGPNANNSCGTLTEAEIAVATAKGWTVSFYG